MVSADKKLKEQGRRKFLFKLFLLIGGIGCFSGLLLGGKLAHHAFFLKSRLHAAFAAEKGREPSRIYARYLVLEKGKKIDPSAVGRELARLGYRSAESPDLPGRYADLPDGYDIFFRDFAFEDGDRPAIRVLILWKNGRIVRLSNLKSGETPGRVRMEPLQIGALYPENHEGRIYLKKNAFPPLLIWTLLAVEDRDFYGHWGIRPSAMLRAAWVNFKKGRIVQGGSTLTQQLVKRYLPRERTFSRKIDESIMALFLEKAYKKDEILETYLNTVYLGQDGKRALRGFGFGARHYFGHSVRHLSPSQIALLVGMLKGPSRYHPRRFPSRACSRRDHVLGIMYRKKLISNSAYTRLMKTPLDLSPSVPMAKAFPAYFEQVRRELKKHQNQKETNRGGYRIFTAMNPEVQNRVEDCLEKRLSAIESETNRSGLEAAAVVVDIDQGEVIAVAGSRVPGGSGFNRALNAKRPIGSLVKPAVFLTALEKPERYHLDSPLSDHPMSVKTEKSLWSPRNFGGVYHGVIPLYQALTRSYNSATVRLGMGLGLEKIEKTLYKLGLSRKTPLYPSLLLGAISLSPMEVAQIYHTIAAGGVKTRISALRSICRGENRHNIERKKEQVFEPQFIYLLDQILTRTIQEGTAAAVRTLLPPGCTAAGKTGTSNELRDSWFAGYAGRSLVVVWVGKDDFSPCGFTGAKGALRIWADILSAIYVPAENKPIPGQIRWTLVLPQNKEGSELRMKKKPGIKIDTKIESIPYIEGFLPETAMGSDRVESAFDRWLEQLATPGN